MHCLGVVLFLCLISFLPNEAYAQRVALKTNLVDWLTLSPNLGAEFTLNSHMTLDLSATGSPGIRIKGLYLKHVRVQPELKYWFGSLLSHHYLGATAFYSGFDLNIKEKGFYGDAAAVGITYGYSWILSRRWNIEVSTGAGIIGYRMVRYTSGEAHDRPDGKLSWQPAPLKLNVSFVYILK